MEQINNPKILPVNYTEDQCLIKYPKISVITVVFNGIKHIESTISSVIKQDYLDLEYIVIDGKSTDGTIEIIKKYESKINYWISEPDKGIYDAMNKGIDIATGDWVIFMNCGDLFFNKDTLKQVFEAPIPDDIALLCGGAFIRSEWGNFYSKARPDTQLWKSFVHQSLFSRIDLNRKYKFNLKFKAASDYDFIYTLFSKNYKFLSLNIIVSDILYISSGFSSVNEICSKKEVLKSIILHRMGIYDFAKHYFYHWFALVRKLMSIVIKEISPSLIKYVRRIRDKNKHE